MANIGPRLKFFRQRARMSQLELEVAIGTTPGAISRIESGKVNPTKETVLEIAEILHLNSLELDYLQGKAIEAVSEKEIHEVETLLSGYLSKKGVIAYISDERWRIFKVSSSLIKMLRASEETVTKSYGMTVIDMLLNDELGVNKFIKNEMFDTVLRVQLENYYDEVGFMIDDPIYLKTVKLIKSNTTASKIWDEIKNQKTHYFNTVDMRVVYFNLMGLQIPFNYSREPIRTQSRFVLIEYKPVSKFVNLVNKLIL